MPARGVISPTRWYLLSSHIICNGKFNLVVIFSLSARAHQSTYELLLCSSVSLISSWRAYSIAKSLTSRSAMPEYSSIFVIIFRIPAKVDSEFLRALLFYPPPPLLWYASWIPIGSLYCNILVLHIGSHLNDAWFAEEDEEENDGCWGVWLVGPCYTWTQWWKLDNCCARR